MKKVENNREVYDFAFIPIERDKFEFHRVCVEVRTTAAEGYYHTAIMSLHEGWSIRRFNKKDENFINDITIKYYSDDFGVGMTKSLDNAFIISSYKRKDLSSICSVLMRYYE